MSERKKKRLGEILRDREHVTPEDLERALVEQKERVGQCTPLGEILLQRGFVQKADLVSALEEVARFQYVDARFVTVDKAVLQLVPPQVAEQYMMLPIAREGRCIIAIMAEPHNLKSLDELRFITGMNVIPRLGFRTEIEEAITKCYAELEPTDADTSFVSFIEQADASDMQFFTASSSEQKKAAMEEFRPSCAMRRLQPCAWYRRFFGPRRPRELATCTLSHSRWEQWFVSGSMACCAN